MKLMPPLKIHCWGGVGSQLYALAVYERLLVRMPNRKIIIVFHSFGVTERIFELSDYVADFLIENDYKTTNIDFNEKVNKKSLKETLFVFLKLLLLKLGILATSNNEFEYMRIRPWVLILRGHYSDIRIPNHIAKKIWYTINSKNTAVSPTFDQGLLNVQIRLGDLLTIDSKSPTDSSVLTNTIIELIQSYKIRKILVFSDSPQIAFNLLKTSLYSCEIQAVELMALDTIIALAKSYYFLGTSSKISIWAAIFKLSLNNSGLILLPSNLNQKVEENLVGDFRSSLVKYYLVN